MTEEAQIGRAELERWADILLDHSMGGIRPEDVVMVKGERICWPLMEVLEEKIIAAGAIADVFVVAPNNERGRVWSAAMGRNGTQEQAMRSPGWVRARYEAMNKYIEVAGAEAPSSYAGLSAEQTKWLATAEQPHAAIRLAKRWVLTLFPTPAFAKLEGLSLSEYTRLLVNASTTDPLPLKPAEERLAPLLDAGETLTLTTTEPRSGRELVLTMSIAPSVAELSYGLRNFPDGEIFTSPDACSTEGEVFVDLPVHYGGSDIAGIYLRFEAGRIVEYSAERGAGQLAAIIETDEGSHRLGEIAFGMNPALQTALKHPLLVEKIGGTAHIAIGASYECCFSKNRHDEAEKRRLAELKLAGVINHSAQHVDIVIDFRPGGAGRRVYIDSTELVVRDGIWVPAD